MIFLFAPCPAVPPRISSQTQKYLAPVDSSVTLQCQANGSPPPSVAWHKDGQPLNESVRQRVLGSGSLQIAFIQPSDTGRYTCTAANAAGTVSLEMSLTVQSKFQSLNCFEPQKWRYKMHVVLLWCLCSERLYDSILPKRATLNISILFKNQIDCDTLISWF